MANVSIEITERWERRENGALCAHIEATWAQVSLNDANKVKEASTKAIVAHTRGLAVHAHVLDHVECRHIFAKRAGPGQGNAAPNANQSVGSPFPGRTTPGHVPDLPAKDGSEDETCQTLSADCGLLAWLRKVKPCPGAIRRFQKVYVGRSDLDPSRRLEVCRGLVLYKAPKWKGKMATTKASRDFVVLAQGHQKTAWWPRPLDAPLLPQHHDHAGANSCPPEPPDKNEKDRFGHGGEVRCGPSIGSCDGEHAFKVSCHSSLGSDQHQHMRNPQLRWQLFGLKRGCGARQLRDGACA